jgi:hypothetical protein
VTPVFQIFQRPAPAFFWTSNDQWAREPDASVIVKTVPGPPLAGDTLIGTRTVPCMNEWIAQWYA